VGEAMNHLNELIQEMGGIDLIIIKHKKERACITKRWGIIAFVLKAMPSWLYYKLQAAHPDRNDSKE
jgi:hypothetical protein